jgi:hypothetical protein
MTDITLTWAEMLVAANVGIMRNVQSLRLGRKRIGADDTWTANIEGAAGEMAVAKMLGLYWAGAIGDIEADDVGPYQVKTNTSRKWDDLILRKWNRPDRIYISVLSFVPRFIIAGWIFGEEGMQEEFYREGAPGMPAFFVPRSLLHPMSDLPSSSAIHEAA